MSSLSARIAITLVAVFLVITGVLAITSADEPGEQRLSIGAAAGVLGLGLGAAWCALWPLTRRIRRLGDALGSLAQGSNLRPLRLDDANNHGDELARLAAQAERVSEHIVTQQAALAQLARQRRELLANVSHDLRTPLASMQGYLELLLLRQGNLEPAEAHNYLQTAARQSERLGRLVGDLFELTRLEAGDALPALEPFELAELVQDVAQRFAADAEARDVALRACAEDPDEGECAGHGGVRSEGLKEGWNRGGRKEGQGASPRPAFNGAVGGGMLVLADIALIERVLGNLVDNALRHTPAGGSVRIVIGSDERRARVAVRDTGAGIAAEELPGIFERYDRASRVGDTGASHAGLGLAIAQRIVQLHGSSLQVRSAAGEGTCVCFDLARAGVRGSAAMQGGGTAQRGHGLPA